MDDVWGGRGGLIKFVVDCKQKMILFPGCCMFFWVGGG